MYDKELLEIKKKVDKMLAPKTPEYKQGYNKAIDDFAERIMECCSMSDMNRKMIKQIAEQLKN